MGPRYVVLANGYGTGALGDVEVHGMWRDLDDAAKFAEGLRDKGFEVEVEVIHMVHLP